jgi:hypothetical protein
MEITITDPELLARFEQATTAVNIKAPDGRVLGQFVVENLYKLPPGVKSPFTEEEMAERRKDSDPGRSLAEILRDLQARQH